MATTKLNNIINPQVMGDMIEAKVNALAKLTPYAKVDTSLEGFRETQRQYRLGITSVMQKTLTLNQEMKWIL